MSATTDVHEPQVEDSLYARVGGAPAVDAAVAGFYTRVLADAELAPYFAGADLESLRAHQRAFLTMALGGPRDYRGRSLDRAHQRLEITDDAFDRVVGHLADTLQELGVDAATIAAIADALVPVKPQIVSAQEASR